MANSTVEAGIRTSLQSLAEAKGWRQEDIAGRLRAVGMDWHRGTVASFFRGDRHLTLDELVLLPVALGVKLTALLGDEPMRVGYADVDPATVAAVLAGRRVSPSEFGAVEAAPSGIVATRTRKDRDMRRSLPHVIFPTEAERRAAKRLGVTAAALATAARSLWGRSLDEQRDQEVAATAGEKSARAVAGHVTKRLLVDLEQHLQRRR